MPLLVQFQRRATLEIADPSRGRAYLRWKNPQAMPESTVEGDLHPPEGTNHESTDH